jgi:hypothetical protein
MQQPQQAAGGWAPGAPQYPGEQPERSMPATLWQHVPHFVMKAPGVWYCCMFLCSW